MLNAKIVLHAIFVASLLLGSWHRAGALPQETIASVVSVLPITSESRRVGKRDRPGIAPEGSGIALGPGIIATAWHVIESAERIDIRLADGRVFPATAIAHDAATDIALLSTEADATTFEFVKGVELAQPVCAIGNAFGLGLSVTCGVVSASGVSNAGFNRVEDFIQTDAAINPGFSGGALVDDEGRLVGMVSAIFASEGDANIGVNFAVSTRLLMRVADALLQDGAVHFPDPGWRLVDIEDETRRRIAAPRIAELESGGPAENAGLRSSDLIISIDGQRVRSPRDAVTALAVIDQERDTFEVVFDRSGSEQSVMMAFTAKERISAAREKPDACPHPATVCLMRQAVFPVSSFDPVGSATRIGPDTLVTNRHVVGDRRDAVVHTPDGPQEADVVASAYMGDLVLLKTSGLPEDGFVPSLLPKELSSDAYFAIGADVARREVRVFDPGVLIAPPADAAMLGRVHVTAPMQPGVSGGALVDANGQLVGIAVGGGEGRFEAIPVSDIRSLLDLRDDTTAEAVTTRLGGAFVVCAEGLEASRSQSSQDAQDHAALTETCSAAQNHGQLLEAGRVLAATGHFDEAADLHAAAVEQVPNSINARLSLLVSLQLGARFEEMTEHARWLIDMAPEDPQALRFAIQSGVWGKDPDLAEAGYAALVKADPVQAQAARRFIDSAPPAPPRR